MKRLSILFMALGLMVGSVSMAASVVPDWSPAAEATIHPGVQTHTAGIQCTANFVFYDSDSVYLGQSAHCSGFNFGEANNGCSTAVLPLGTPVDIQGASQLGTIVYNSWLTMQQVAERNSSACAANDFALVRLHPDDHDAVNPSLPVWGGPTAPRGGSSFGDKVYAYGNSSLRGGISALSPKYGINTTTLRRRVDDALGWGSDTGRWRYHVYLVTPGIFGDSGSPVLDARGRALGVLNTISLDGTSGISDLSKMVEYMKAKTNLDAIRFAKGTESFLPLP